MKIVLRIRCWLLTLRLINLEWRTVRLGLIAEMLRQRRARLLERLTDKMTGGERA